MPEKQEEEEEEGAWEKTEGKEEEEEKRVRNMEFWLATKHQLQSILDLINEVQQIKCDCCQPDCPFQDSTSPDGSPHSGSPRTSPTTFRRDVSYGGFERMIKSEDVVYDSLEGVDPAPVGEGPFRRGAPVVRRKRNTVANIFSSDYNTAAAQRLARRSVDLI